MRFLAEDTESIRSSTKAFLDLVATPEKLYAYGAGSSSTYLVQGLLSWWNNIRASHRTLPDPGFSPGELQALKRFESALKTLPQYLPPTETPTEEFLQGRDMEQIHQAARQCLASFRHQSATRFFQRVADVLWHPQTMLFPKQAAFSSPTHVK